MHWEQQTGVQQCTSNSENRSISTQMHGCFVIFWYETGYADRSETMARENHLLLVTAFYVRSLWDTGQEASQRKTPCQWRLAGLFFWERAGQVLVVWCHINASRLWSNVQISWQTGVPNTTECHMTELLDAGSFRSRACLLYTSDAADE